MDNQWVATTESIEQNTKGGTHPCRTLQFGSPTVNQKVTDVRLSIMAFDALVCCGQADGNLANFQFADIAPPSNSLDGMAIAIAGSKVHMAVNASRVAGKGLFDHALIADKGVPVEGIQEAKT
jgi:hypothetical protein